MKIKAVTFALIMTGCLDSNTMRWEDIPTATLAPHADDPTLQADFEQYARGAATEWAQLLAPLGCSPPFVIDLDDGDHPVTLVRRDAWDWADDGWTDDDQIQIGYDTIPERALLLHEMGHAMGLSHHSGKTIMSVPVGLMIYDQDIVDAACAMRCGSCEHASVGANVGAN